MVVASIPPKFDFPDPPFWLPVFRDPELPKLSTALIWLLLLLWGCWYELLRDCLCWRASWVSANRTIKGLE
jgi:hypothetical protein